jgi:hypothetical protein
MASARYTINITNPPIGACELMFLQSRPLVQRG